MRCTPAASNEGAANIGANLVSPRLLVRIHVIVAGSALRFDGVKPKSLRALIGAGGGVRISGVDHHATSEVCLVLYAPEILICAPVDRCRYRIESAQAAPRRIFKAAKTVERYENL